MKNTTNYGFKKPEGTDFYNVNDFNDNMDAIDTELASLQRGNILNSQALNTISLDLQQTDLALEQHTGNEENPHNVTAEQVGLGNVNNTSDLDKPLSKATQNEVALIHSTLGYTRKNVVRCSPNEYYNGYNVYGCTFVINDDKSVSITGQPTQIPAYLTYIWKHPIAKGSYILNGCPSGGGSGRYYLKISLYVNDENIAIYEDYGTGVSFDVTRENTTIIVQIVVNSTAITMNHTFYPMIRLADIEDETYEPYAPDINTRLNEELVCDAVISQAMNADFTQYKKITCYVSCKGYVLSSCIHTHLLPNNTHIRLVAGCDGSTALFDITQTSIQLVSLKIADATIDINTEDGRYYVFGHQ